MTDAGPGPLAGVRVLDFSNLLPGPLAGLILAEAGAEVLKVERPGGGDEMRSYVPRIGRSSANFALLNRDKGSVTIDLKSVEGRQQALTLADDADVVIEQFRPGVMGRLGLGYETVRERNPGVVYCSITGYGQDGPLAQRAGHDLTYLAETGILALTEPALPPMLIADIAGGAYPAVMNITMALLARERTGAGIHLDVSMTDNLFPLMYWALADGFAGDRWPRGGDALVTGASPRYQLYATADGRLLAAAPLEDRFWARFCEVIELPHEFRDDARDADATAAAVAERIGRRRADEWARRFEGEDVCCAIVRTVDEALDDPAFQARRILRGSVGDGDRSIPALPVPLASAWRTDRAGTYPSLGCSPPRWSTAR